MKAIKCLFLILISFFVSSMAIGKEFSYENLLYTQLKINNFSDFESIVESYMYKFRPEVYEKYKNDEFEFDNKRKETINILKDKLSRFNLGDSFVINFRSEFNEYDFKNKKFYFSPVSSNTFFEESLYTPSSLPDSIKVKFDNPEIINGIAMDTNVAKDFLGKRKSSFGYVNRNVIVELKFKPIKTEGNNIIAHIESYKVLDDKGEIIQKN